MEDRQYKLRPGARAPKGFDVQEAGAALQEILDKHPEVTTEEVVNFAKSSDCPFHAWFQWDDTKAAEQHRLDQARGLMRSIRITIITPEEKVFEVSIASSIDSDLTDKARAYTSTVDGLSDPNTRAKILSLALRELKVIRSKYAMLSELSQVVQSIDTALSIAKKTG